MKLVIPPVLVEEQDGFENDLFGRKGFGESLRNIVSRSTGELVISLDGQWGEGKTTFVKMWQGLLNEENIPNIYIDAFANDYIDDAFIAVTSAISDYAGDIIQDKAVVTAFREKAKDVGGRLLSWSVKLGVKAATLGLVREAEIEELKDIQGDIAQGATNLLEGFIADHLESHSEDLAKVQSFRELLSELPRNINKEEPKPLVIIIDELDRCKPTYAVDVIEKIKHLFSVENVVFVLVMHKAQLQEAIKCIYGQNIDAQTYLQKFVHIETTIPKRVGDVRQNDIKTYAEKLLQLHELETWGDDQSILSSVNHLSGHFHLSLRKLEKVFTNIALIYGATSENQYRLSPIIVFISMVKVMREDVHRKLLLSSISYEELCAEINVSEQYIAGQPREFRMIMKWIQFALMTEEEYAQFGDEADDEFEFRGFAGGLWNHNLGREDIIPYFMKKLTMFVVR